MTVRPVLSSFARRSAGAAMVCFLLFHAAADGSSAGPPPGPPPAAPAFASPSPPAAPVSAAAPPSAAALTPAEEGGRGGREDRADGDSPASEPPDSPESDASAETAGTYPAPRPFERAVGFILLQAPGFLPDVRVELDPETAGAELSGSIEAFHRRTYIVEAAAGQVLKARLAAPAGVWIEVWKDDLAVPSGGRLLQRAEGALPAGGGWRVSVVSAAGRSVDYRLSVEVLTPRPVVHLTFDDGPHPVHTPEVLELLDRYNARATFFVVGYLVQRYPELVQRIVDEGHILANHTWSHENLTKLSRKAFDRTIARTQEVLGGRASACLRPPYAAITAANREWAAAHGLDVILWDVSGADWLDFTDEQIAGRVLRGAFDGSIVMLHDGGGDRSRTVRALEMILEGLSERGMRFLPICGPAEHAAGG